MASKGPKSIAPKRTVKPLATSPKAAAETPPVPFVAQPTPAKPVAKAAAGRSIAKPLPVAVPAPAPVTPVVATPPAAVVPSEPAAPAASVMASPEPIDPEPTISTQTESPPAIAPATAITQKDLSTMDATINTAADTAQTQAKTMFADANDRAKTAMEKGSKMIAELSEFSKGNLEAVVESSKIAAKGAEDIARYTSDYVRNSVEKASTTASQFASIKSPTDFFKLHSEMTKQAMDSMMAETAKFTEGYVKLLGEIAQPISNRVAVAVEKVKVAA
ncbi:phasin family protein [Sphingomonas sp. PsM26]|nr:phasin family protein [Sphingomonas sp. PsM26]